MVNSREDTMTKTGKIPVTVALPVRNEAKNLRACLDRLKRFEEVFVIDSASTDETLTIARSCEVEVIDFRWNGQFPKKRNWFLEQGYGAHDWVLFLDADELVTEAFCEELSERLPSTSHVGFRATFHNWFMGGRLKHGDVFRKLILFRRGSGRYERIDEDRWSGLDMEIHEHPVLAGTVGELNSPIIHEDRRGLDSYLAKHNEYSSWEARRTVALRSQPGAFESLTDRQRTKYRYIDRWWFATAYFLASYLLKKGFLDGWRGYVFARLKGQYFGHIRLKIQEMEQ